MTGLTANMQQPLKAANIITVGTPDLSTGCRRQYVDHG